MWFRNLFFLAFCATGLALPLVGLAPRIGPATASVSEPPPQDDDFRRTIAAVDAVFRRTWSERKLTPAAPADDLVVARRLALALTGSIPSLEEIRALEREPAAGRLDRRTAALSADRRSADYLAERLARAFVGVENGPFLQYRRRRFVSWLSDQLAAGVPYDAVVRHLIADEGLWTDAPAVNFLTVTIQPMQGRDPDPKALAAKTARAFLGVRIDCAECHDHPFDVWKQRDFQGLAAFYADARQQNIRGLRDVERPYVVEDAKTGEKRTVEPCVPFEQEIYRQTGRTREALADWVTHPDNRAFGRATANRAWAVLFGRPLVEPIDDVRRNDDPSQRMEREVLDLLADDLTAHHYDLRRLLSLIASTAVFRLDSRTDDEPTPEQQRSWAVFPLVRLRPEQVIGAIMQSMSATTLDAEHDVAVRFVQFITQNEFVRRYGDMGEDEFAPQGGTIPQRLLMMNGRLVRDKLRDPLVFNAAARIATTASHPAAAVEAAYLAVLTRRPTAVELEHFVGRMNQPRTSRTQAVEDLCWALFNSTEFAWNH